jgi:hypothetical protein
VKNVREQKSRRGWKGFRHTITIFILSCIICGVLFAEFGPVTWWYAGVCGIITFLVFCGEAYRP